jgi:hypothetical protein
LAVIEANGTMRATGAGAASDSRKAPHFCVQELHMQNLRIQGLG